MDATISTKLSLRKIEIDKPKFILCEKHIQFGDSTIGHTNCQRVHHCSCDCNYQACPIFIG